MHESEKNVYEKLIRTPFFAGRAAVEGVRWWREVKIFGQKKPPCVYKIDIMRLGGLSRFWGGEVRVASTRPISRFSK